MSEAFILNSRYRLTKELGSGGMAVVYKAEDLELGRQVAVKLLREGYVHDLAFLTRFQQEARAAASLDHPNVVSIYDVGRDGKLYYIVMEYVEGQSLKSLLQEQAPLAVNAAIDLAIQICAGVGAAHRLGLVHCDLKPQNILVTPDERVKVADFGIACAMEARAAEAGAAVWATPQYAAPEQLQGHPVSPAADVYAVAVILYEMLTSRLPFQGQTPEELSAQHALSAPPSLAYWAPQVPARLEQIVLQGLAKEPARRYRTATQLGHLLIEYRRASEQATSARPPATPAPHVPAPAGEVESSIPEPVESAGPDWLAWFMGVLAVMMIAGLIPVWMLVVQRYTLPRRLGLRTPFATPAPSATPLGGDTQLIVVPNVQGLEQEEAQRVMEASGLGFAVVGERNDPKIPPLHVVTQTIGPGQRVERGQVVGVILSQGPRFVSVPNVVGLPADSVEPGLEEIGLTVSREETWSAEPTGVVIAQEPPAGTMVAEGAAVVLTVSIGARIPLDANLGDQVMLVAADMERIEVTPGGRLALRLHWRALAKMEVSYKVFVHVTRADGSVVLQQENEPRDGTYPTTSWQVGEQVPDTYTFPVPANARPASYWIKVGMTEPDTGQRLPVVSPGTARVEDGSIVVREVRVVESE